LIKHPDSNWRSSKSQSTTCARTRRTHAASPTQLEALTQDIRTYGIVQPILARREDKTVIGGHQRLTAARRLGYTTVPVAFLDLIHGKSRVATLSKPLTLWGAGVLTVLARGKSALARTTTQRRRRKLNNMTSYMDRLFSG